jgi:hypothetical protein
MRKGLIATLALILTLGVAGYTVAQQGPPGGRQGMGPGQMGPGTGMQGPMGPGMGGGDQMGGQGMMGMMGQAMEMMGPMMRSPEIMGTMMSIHGEITNLMGEMMQKYGGAMGQMTPEVRQKMQQEMMAQMGDILTKHGMTLKERAKAGGK